VKLKSQYIRLCFTIVNHQADNHLCISSFELFGFSIESEASWLKAKRSMVSFMNYQDSKDVLVKYSSKLLWSFSSILCEFRCDFSWKFVTIFQITALAFPAIIRIIWPRYPQTIWCDGDTHKYWTYIFKLNHFLPKNCSMRVRDHDVSVLAILIRNHHIHHVNAKTNLSPCFTTDMWLHVIFISLI
jgi:hypothetical protein